MREARRASDGGREELPSDKPPVPQRHARPEQRAVKRTAHAVRHPAPDRTRTPLPEQARTHAAKSTMDEACKASKRQLDGSSITQDILGAKARRGFPRVGMLSFQKIIQIRPLSGLHLPRARVHYTGCSSEGIRQTGIKRNARAHKVLALEQARATTARSKSEARARSFLRVSLLRARVGI